MNTRKLMAWVGTSTLLLAGLLGTSITIRAADNPDSEQVSKLLSEANTMAYQLREDAETMASFAGMSVSWQSHVAVVSQIKEHANALAKQVDKLKAARNSASPWQKTAIDRIDPYLEEMNGYTEAVIEQLNKNPDRLRTPEYKEYLEANADYATDLADMIGRFVDYGRTKQRLQNLTDQLELPTH